MKKMTLESMTTEQKLGFVMLARGNHNGDNREFLYDMLRRGCVGGIQVPTSDYEDLIAGVRANADYPVMLCADMECGFPGSGNLIPGMLALAAANDEELAYRFGCITAIDAKSRGFNTVWSPVVDMITGNCLCKVNRTCGTDIARTMRLTCAILRGYLDNGMLATAKHYITGSDKECDTHMREGASRRTWEQLYDFEMQPYLAAMRSPGLPGVMTTHTLFPSIDPKYPVTLSKTILSKLRDEGFDGVIMSDSLAMMGILQKFPEPDCYGLAIAAGCDVVLPNYRITYREAYKGITDCYRRGVFTEERLNDAVRHILRAQELTLGKAQAPAVTAEHRAVLDRITREGICGVADDGIPFALERGKKRLFVVLCENLYRSADGTEEISFEGGINEANLEEVEGMIRERFPDDEIIAINQFPSRAQNERTCYAASKAEEVVYLTYSSSGAYMGSEALTDRVLTLMDSMKEKIAAVIHVGNPYAMEDIPHVPRIVFTFGFGDSLGYALDVPAGRMEPKGLMPVKLHLQ